MVFQLYTIFLFPIVFFSCQTGQLTVVADLPKDLKEISAVETIVDSHLIWVIEDAGNANKIYGLNDKGDLLKEITLINAENNDWEDLTSDEQGNIYIGDFGNNSKKRSEFTIYKVSAPEKQKTETTASRIDFVLPDTMDSKDFESFFLYGHYFYIFSKGKKKEIVIKVPNRSGKHTAQLVDTFELPGKGKNNKITSAAISKDGNTLLLLNHDKVWKITNYTSDHFFKGTVETLEFDHDSQKEGVCFKDNTTIYITDERNKSEGGNLYSFNLK